jgi:hypothetical protein
MFSLISTCVLHTKIGVCCGSDSESRTDLRNWLDIEVHSDALESSPDNEH